MSAVRLRLADALRRTDALEMYEEFLDTQWLPPDEVTALQAERLQRLLAHAYQRVPYYRTLFDDAGCTPADIGGPADLTHLPILTKAIVRQAGDDLHATNMEEFGPRAKATGGSTGHPLKYYIDRRAHSAQWAFIYRGWHLGGWRPGDRVVFIGGTSLVPSTTAVKKWCYVRLNSWLLLSAFDFDPARGQWIPRLRRFGARFMYAYASSAYLLARHAESIGETGLRFDAVFTTAEMLPDHHRSTIERAFSCEVFDLYGGSDGAGYGFECERHAGLHHVAESSIVEIVDDAGRPVAPGRPGHVISTDLFGYGMPFIRYDTGDLATMTDEPCPCGRGLPRFSSIKGRSTDYVILPSGKRIHAQYFMYLFREYEWISQFSIIQERSDLVRIFLRPSGPVVVDDVTDLQGALDRKLPGVTVELATNGEIPMTAGGKHSFVVNKIQA